MNRQAVYERLQAGALCYAELKDVPVIPADEPLVPISSTNNLVTEQIGTDMLPITGNKIYVREHVAQRLGQASLALAEINKSLALQVVYGYRALSIQRKLFNDFRKQLQAEYEGAELLEAVHRLIAVPNVAGHPTGGAVDIQIVQANEPLDFGTKVWEFVPDSYTYSPFVDKEAASNRQVLRQVMMAAGFAPFDGEWWHFSYGDKEWARYYNKPCALYEQVEFTSNKNSTI